VHLVKRLAMAVVLIGIVVAALATRSDTPAAHLAFQIAFVLLAVTAASLALVMFLRVASGLSLGDVFSLVVEYAIRAIWR
jgi:hypothetical protein